MRDGEALHAEARRAVLQHPVEGRDAIRRDPAIRFVESEKAGDIGLHDGNQPQRHADHVRQCAAIVLEHVFQRSVRAPDADIERGKAALRRQVQRHGLLARQNLLHERRQQRLEGGQAAPAGRAVHRLDEGLDLVLDGQAPLGEFDVARQLRDAGCNGIAPSFEPRKSGFRPRHIVIDGLHDHRSSPSCLRRASTSRRAAPNSSASLAFFAWASSIKAWI